jgi:5-formyltetrahydrofolate cyclo-ligase
MDKPEQPTAGQKTKAALREQVRTELKKLSPASRETLSLRLCALLEQQEIWKQARSILFYAPMTDEPDIWQLVRDSVAAGKTTALPRFVAEQNRYVACLIQDISRDVRSGQFGIREPHEVCATISVNRLDLILVPGVAFDFNGHRLGRGKGFYDQLLETVGGPTCGVAFDEQILETVPVEPHDVRLSCILTPTRWKVVEGPRAVLK